MGTVKKSSNRVQAALVSVYDKTNIVPFAQQLVRTGITIYSSGGTYSTLQKADIACKKVEDLTRFTEIFDGRVKTLHPAVHGSILYRRNNNTDVRIIRDLEYIDLRLVVVNLYPFEEVIKNPKINIKSAIENIDIGGVALLRAAAKNHEWVTVVSDIEDYDDIIKEIRQQKNTKIETRRRLAVKAFRATASYDNAISNFFGEQYLNEKNFQLNFVKGKELRYGENPHQKGWIYVAADAQNLNENAHQSGNVNSNVGPINQQPILTKAEILHGKEMSYNNYLDAEAALACVWDFFPNKAAVVVKHQTPCGLATGSELIDCFERAWEGDSVSAFGSVVATNQTFDFKSTRFLTGKFVEVLIAPDFEPKALEWLKRKSKNLRIIRTPKPSVLTEDNLRKIKIAKSKDIAKPLRFNYITGGILVQEKDKVLYNKMTSVGFKKKERLDADFYEFAFRAVKHVKSNAICICHSYANGQYMLIGIGTGQPNRIDSITKLATIKAKENLTRIYPMLSSQAIEELLNDCVLASDAFFPFKDSIEASYDSGIRKIIQPGGSIRDAEIISEAKKRRMELVFTGIRHFLH